MIKALAATSAKGPLKPFTFEPGPLLPDQVEVQVSYCGVCHSDLSMLDNDWQMSTYPFVPGHEVVGTVAAVGSQVKHLEVGRTVGVGWYSKSCMICPQCMTGHHNLCLTAEQTIVGRFGGFADRIRCGAMWTLPLPAKLDPARSGPLFCGGITVFNPIVQCHVQPTERVGVVRIGGLGHLALQFLNKWGCAVTAFTSSASKRDEALRLGAHHVVNSRDSAALQKLAHSLDFILITANVPLDWDALLAALAPRGRLHIVGAVLEPIPLPAFALITGAKSVSGSPLGSPALTATMLEFCARHDILPITETFPMSQANDALERLRAGQARYRLVLTNDLK